MDKLGPNTIVDPAAITLAMDKMRQSLEMRERFERENGITRICFPRKDILTINDWQDPLEPNYFIAYCRKADSVDLRIASTFRKLQWLLDDLTDWQEAIIDHSPQPYEFETRCLDEIHAERAVLMDAVQLLNGDLYWNAYIAE